MKKFFRVVSLILVLVIGLMGCSKENNDVVTETDGESADEVVTITVWHMLDSSVVEAIEGAYEEVFYKENPNIKVNFEKQENYGEKLKLLSSQSQANVDVVAAPHDWIGAYAEMGILEDVDGLIEQEVLDQLIPTTVSAMTYKDKLYGVPSTLETVAMLYNTDIIQDPPTTTDELLEVAKNYTKDGQYGFLMPPSDAYFNSAWIYGNGGSYLSDDGESLLYSAENVETFEFLSQLGEYYPKDLDYGMVNELFKQGNAAVILAGPWSISEIKESGVPYEMALLPEISTSNNDANPYMSVQGMMLVSGCENKDEAIKVMEFYGSEEVATALAVSAGSIPANENAYEVDEVKDSTDLMGYMEQSKLGEPMPSIPEMNAMWQPIQDSLVNVVVLGDDIEKTLQKFQSEAEEVIENMQ